jgi:hypothetical protein
LAGGAQVEAAERWTAPSRWSRGRGRPTGRACVETTVEPQ